MSRNRWYWTFQITGWTCYAILGIVMLQLFLPGKAFGIAFQFLAAGMMLFSTHLFRYFLKHRGWRKFGFWRLLIRLFPLALLCAIIINIMNSAYFIYVVDFFSAEEFSVGVFLVYVLQTMIYFALWVGIYLGIFYFRNYKQEEIEKWKLQSAVKDAELIALKAQINPHFLFNALNNIRALILEDHMKARDMVSHLSELLRYSIQFNNHEKVTVADELEIVNKYLELEHVHYEKRMKYQIQCGKGLDRCKIPPMIVQLMAENAVKHGISQVKDGGEILISLTTQDKELVIEVRNTGELKENERNGIGIRNATERIRILFEQEPSFELNQEGHMVISTLKLPIEK